MSERVFATQCEHAGSRLIELLARYPGNIAVATLAGTAAAMIKTNNVPRDTFVAMLDSALEDMADV